VDALYLHVANSEAAVSRGLQVISMTLDQVNARPLSSDSFALMKAGDVCAKALKEYGYESEEERTRVSLHVEKDFVLRGNETAYLFVLFNLLKNAFYYLSAYPRAQILISVDAPCAAH